MSQGASEIDSLLESLGFSTPRPAPSAAVIAPPPETVDDETPTEAELRELSESKFLMRNTPEPAPAPRPAQTKENSLPFILFKQTGRFFPFAPDTLQEAGLHITEVSDLILKFLAVRGIESGFNIARQVGLKFPLVEGVLRQLKADRLVGYKNSSTGGDYMYELTVQGRDRALVLAEQCSYFQTAPVPLEQYIDSVKAQSLVGRKPSLDSIRAAFEELQVNEKMISNIGQAIHSGRGMFLFGPAGNGKTSMAELITKSFGDTIWIPRCITASGEIIRLFDPNRHRPAPPSGCDPEYLDARWVHIERPTVVAGGELRMDNLEITYIRRTGIGEAPLQMKANCGTLLIDDFGRQRMSIDELLNRWIVPLEQRHDYLHLESGRSIQVPFDQLIIFSSNLEPKDLVDEAFLRRIPYKIEVSDPTEEEFRRLFRVLAGRVGFDCSNDVLDYVVSEHYVKTGRTFRFCHPRDLLRQMENRCSLHNLPKVVTCEALDEAVENYFSIM
jgi:hypothetical protein